MFYFNEEAYDMLLILGKRYIRWKIVTGTFFWSNTLRKIFSRLAKGVVQSHNKATQICRLIRDKKTAEILVSTKLNPYDSLRRRDSLRTRFWC